jgi:hypothetical protein
MARRLSRPSPQARAVLRRVGVPVARGVQRPGAGVPGPVTGPMRQRMRPFGLFRRGIVLRGPVRITIAPA